MFHTRTIVYSVCLCVCVCVLCAASFVFVRAQRSKSRPRGRVVPGRKKSHLCDEMCNVWRARDIFQRGRVKSVFGASPARFIEYPPHDTSVLDPGESLTHRSVSPAKCMRCELNTPEYKIVRHVVSRVQPPPPPPLSPPLSPPACTAVCLVVGQPVFPV